MRLLRPVMTLIGAGLLAASLGGCGSINSVLAGGMGDFIPAWAGGLPADAPPRPGTPEYDQWLQRQQAKDAAAAQATSPAPAASAAR